MRYVLHYAPHHVVLFCKACTNNMLLLWRNVILVEDFEHLLHCELFGGATIEDAPGMVALLADE